MINLSASEATNYGISNRAWTEMELEANLRAIREDTMTQDEVNKILVEAEGGCWHEYPDGYDVFHLCSKCKVQRVGHDNPDFSKWENFGRLLDIAGRLRIGIKFFPNSSASVDRNMLIMDGKVFKDFLLDEIDEIPALVSTELVRIIKKGRE